MHRFLPTGPGPGPGRPCACVLLACVFMYRVFPFFMLGGRFWCFLFLDVEPVSLLHNHGDIIITTWYVVI